MSDLIKLEFEALRKEIDCAKDRLFKLFVSGITFPLIIIAVIAKFPDISKPIVFTFPILLLTMCYRYEYERAVITRAGSYIREVLEPKVESINWESWLFENCHKLSPNRSLALSFYLLISLYYFAPFIIFLGFKANNLNINTLEYMVSNKFNFVIAGFYILLWIFVVVKPVALALKSKDA